MNPNYDAAAAAAFETRSRFGCSDPARILRQLANVKLISFESSDMPIDQDAFSCVQENKYIVIYNSGLSPVRQRSALARELGHVMLCHDGTGPEDIWMEEAFCFAYHFLCPALVGVIKYRPDHSSLSMSFKSMRIFASIHELKSSLAEEHNRINRFLGKKEVYTPDDVQILSLPEKDIFGHWNNYASVVLAGRPLGFCGQ